MQIEIFIYPSSEHFIRHFLVRQSLLANKLEPIGLEITWRQHIFFFRKKNLHCIARSTNTLCKFAVKISYRPVEILNLFHAYQSLKSSISLHWSNTLFSSLSQAWYSITQCSISCINWSNSPISRPVETDTQATYLGATSHSNRRILMDKKQWFR